MIVFGVMIMIHRDMGIEKYKGAKAKERKKYQKNKSSKSLSENLAVRL